MKSLEKTIRTTLDASIREFGLDSMTDLVDDVRTNKVKRKISRQEMLDSLFVDGVCHQHSDELMKLVCDEYQSNMVEIASGNGQARNVWNYATQSYDIYLSADGHDTNGHNTNGLSDALVDSYEGIADKNLVTVPSYEVTTDSDGNELRIDDMACMVVVNNSSYSIWDTILDKGQLIVRHTSHWYGVGCQFKKDGYKAREAKRIDRKNRKLLGLSGTKLHDDSRTSDKAINVKQINKQKRIDKKLAYQVKLANNGNQFARDALAKIGYNEFKGGVL